MEEVATYGYQARDGRGSMDEASGFKTAKEAEENFPNGWFGGIISFSIERDEFGNKYEMSEWAYNFRKTSF